MSTPIEQAVERDSGSTMRYRAGFTYCAYCDAVFEADAPTANEAVSEHIRTCPQHPMRDVERQNEALRRQLDDLRNVTGHMYDLLYDPNWSPTDDRATWLQEVLLNAVAEMREAKRLLASPGEPPR